MHTRHGRICGRVIGWRAKRRDARDEALRGPAGCRIWTYNNPAYRLMFPIIQQATGSTPSNVFSQYLAIPVGMSAATWLIAAVVELGLTEALAGDDELKVFAPTDAAFAHLGLDADNIGDLPLWLLEEIILYRLPPGQLFAEDLLQKRVNRITPASLQDVRISFGRAARTSGAALSIPRVAPPT